MMVVFHCMAFPNLFPHSPVDEHLVYLQILCQGVKTDLSVSLGAKRDSLAGKWSEASILSRGVLELQRMWKHCGTGLLQTDSTSGMFPPCCSPFLRAEQEKSLGGLGNGLLWHQTV